VRAIGHLELGKTPLGTEVFWQETGRGQAVSQRKKLSAFQRSKMLLLLVLDKFHF